MVSLAENNNGNHGGAGGGYFFRDSDEVHPPNQAYDIPTNNRTAVPHPRRPAIRQTQGGHNRHTSRNSLESTSNSLQPNPIKFKHIYTGYFTMIEIIIILIYVVSCYVDVIMFDTEEENDENEVNNIIEIDKFCLYSIIHIILWCIIGVFDRLVQWQHQNIRRRGHLMFYVRLRNIRRIPYSVISTGNATLVLLFATRKQIETGISFTIFKFNYCLLILVGVELVIMLPILMYYVIITMRFNCKKPSPDAAVSSTTQSVLPFSSPPPDLGFNPDTDTQNVEELLDKQADMIRYLQFHNANLGRKIMELQNQSRH